MSQAFIDSVRMSNAQELTVNVGPSEDNNKRKINISLDSYHHVSGFQNGAGQTVIYIRKGTRSVSVSKSTLLDICDLKETLLLCCSFVETSNT